MPAVWRARRAWWRRLGRDSAYTLTSLPAGRRRRSCLVAVLVAVGAGLAVILVGLPILALGLLTARASPTSSVGGSAG